MSQAVAEDEPELVVFGAATPEPEALTHPLTVWVSVYVPALLTLIDDVVAAVLHNKVPNAVVDKVDVPSQLLTTLTVGVDGAVLIVKLKVWTESQPAALVKVFIYVPDVVYVEPLHA